jgi:hypothetical protein
MILNCPAQPWQRHCGSLLACLHHARIAEHNDACEFRTRPLWPRGNKQKRSSPSEGKFTWKKSGRWQPWGTAAGEAPLAGWRERRRRLGDGEATRHHHGCAPARIAAEGDGIERHEAMCDACGGEPKNCLEFQRLCCAARHRMWTGALWSTNATSGVWFADCPPDLCAYFDSSPRQMGHGRCEHWTVATRSCILYTV